MSKLFEQLNSSYDEPAQKHPLRKWHIPFLILLILGTIFIFRQNNNTNKQGTAVWKTSELMRSEGTIFGTIYHITYESDRDLNEGIKNVLNKVDYSLSPFNKQSTITAINENTCMDADSMLTRVFLLSKQISAETSGAFDITVAPLVNLWGFGFKNSNNVSDAVIDSILQFVGIDGVNLEAGKIVKTHSETMLDCSAIAKGYGVDAVGEFLENEGVKQYMVEIGGEVRVRGFNPKGMKWNIGITRPDDDSTCTKSDIQQIIEVTDMAMATSGNYRNFYVKDGKKYAHTIDPRTGRPVQHNILSATVLTSDCATADAYATSFMVLGLDGAKEILNKHPELMAFIIYNDDKGQVSEWYSPQLKALIKK